MWRSKNTYSLIFPNMQVSRLRLDPEPPRQLRGVLLAPEGRGSLRGHGVDARHAGPGEEGEGETFITLFLVIPGARLLRASSLSGTLDTSLRPGSGI